MRQHRDGRVVEMSFSYAHQTCQPRSTRSHRSPMLLMRLLTIVEVAKTHETSHQGKVQLAEAKTIQTVLNN